MALIAVGALEGDSVPFNPVGKGVSSSVGTGEIVPLELGTGVVAPPCDG